MSDKSGTPKQTGQKQAGPKQTEKKPTEPTSGQKSTGQKSTEQKATGQKSGSQKTAGKNEQKKPQQSKATPAKDKTEPAKTEPKKPAADKAPAKEQDKKAPEASVKASAKEPAKVAEPAVAAVKPSKAPTIIAALALLIALFAVGAAFYIWTWSSERLHQAELAAANRSSQTKTTSKLATSNEATLRTVSSDVQAVQGNVQRLGIQVESHNTYGERIDNAESQARITLEKLGALQNGLNKLKDHVGSSEGAWVVAEIEYLLQIGHQRLILTGDVKVAHVALTTAEQRLNELSDPAFLPVIRELAQEIADLELAKAKQPNLPKMTIDLGTNINRAESLPVKNELKVDQLADGSIAPKSTQGADKSFADDVGTKFHNLFNFRYSKVGETYQPPVTPRRSSFLRQNLILKLEAARIGLLRQNKAAYTSALEASIDWLNTWFDTNDESVKLTITELTGLRDQPIRVEIPDVSKSLRKLRMIKAQINSQRLKRQREEDGVTP